MTGRIFVVRMIGRKSRGGFLLIRVKGNEALKKTRDMTIVVYLDQQLGAAHPKHLAKYAFTMFLLQKSSSK